MKPVLFVVLFFSLFDVEAQNFVWGLDWALASENKIQHDLIFIDTSYNNGSKFYLKNLKQDYNLESPALYGELRSRNKFFIGGRLTYGKKQYKFTNDPDVVKKTDFAYIDFYQTKYLYSRVYAGKEFLTTRMIKPWIYFGYSRYLNVNHYFDDKTDATLKYDAKKYIDWLNKNFRTVHAFSIGVGINYGRVGLYAYYDQNIAPLNEYMHKFTSSSYLVLKADIGAKNIARHIRTYDEETGTIIKKRPYIKRNAFGVSLEYALSAGFNLAKDSVTGFEIAYGKLKEPESIEGGYAFDGYLSVEMRKRAKTKFAPQVTLYFERSLKESSNFFFRHAISWRYYNFIYEKAAKNYQEGLFSDLSSNPTIIDFSYNELSIRNTYFMLINEHKIGYRFVSGSRPNYFVVNAGIRFNWRLKHWNDFEAKVRFVNPTATAGVLYQSNRFSIGLNAENSVISPDKYKYYKNFFSYSVQLNFDISKWDKE